MRYRIARVSITLTLFIHFLGAGALVPGQDPGGLPTARPVVLSSPAGSPATIPSSEQFDLRSKSGREYRVFVSAPARDVPPAGAPVIYVTDGNGNFPIFVAAARRRMGYDPRAVVVGIGYPGEDVAAHRERRAFDLTPAVSAAVAASSANLPGGAYASMAGGNDLFLGFINDELKPIIERKYRIDRGRQALFGHSFGGLFVLHAMFSKPKSFQAYLASSPSLFWNDGSISGEEKAFEEKYAGKEVGARLLLSVGEWEQRPGREVLKEREEIERRLRSFGNAKDLAGRLAASKVRGLSVAFREFAEEDHGSVVLPAAGRGVRFALDGK